MEDELAKDAHKVQADNQSIAIGEINITGTVTGNITIGPISEHTSDKGCTVFKTSKRTLAWLVGIR